ncbi:MAG: c-type cytochrome domain-containing protein [Planctomycetota bacterium]
MLVSTWSVGAQDSVAGQPVQRLGELLAALKSTPTESWARLDAQFVTRAEQLKTEAAAKTAAAAAARAAALEARKLVERRTDEIARLRELRSQLAAISLREIARGGDAASLHAILVELSSTPADAWEVRIGQLESESRAAAERAKTHDQAADSADAVQKKLLASVTDLEAERKRVAALHKLLESMPASTAAASGVPATSPAAPPGASPSASPPAAMPAAVEAAAPAERLVTYDDDVRSIFEDNCTSCHDRGDPSGGLDLTSHVAALDGGGSGRTIRPGDPDGSRLFLLVSHREKPTMPPDEPRIDAPLIETIRMWIEQGAPKDRAQAERMAKERSAARATAASAAAKPVLEIRDCEPPASALAPVRTGVRGAPIRSLAIAPRARFLAVAGPSQVQLLGLDDLRPRGALELDFPQVERVRISADGSALVAAGGQPGRSGSAVVFDLATGKERGRFGQQRDTILAADLSPDAKLVAVGGTQKRTAVYRVDDASPVYELRTDDWTSAIAFSADGRLCAVADRKGNVLVVEAATGREEHALPPVNGGVDALAFSPDSKALAVGGGDRTVRLFRMKDGQQSAALTAHVDRVTALAFSGSGVLSSADATGMVLRWADGGRKRTELGRLGEWVYDLALDSDFRVCTVDWAGRVQALGVVP